MAPNTALLITTSDCSFSAQVAHDDAEVSNPGADASKLTDAMLEEDEHDECRIAELLQVRRSASLSPRLSAAAHCACA